MEENIDEQKYILIGHFVSEDGNFPKKFTLLEVHPCNDKNDFRKIASPQHLEGNKYYMGIAFGNKDIVIKKGFDTKKGENSETPLVEFNPDTNNFVNIENNKNNQIKESKKMSKKIKITESLLRNMVMEACENVMKECGNYCDWNLGDIKPNVKAMQQSAPFGETNAEHNCKNGKCEYTKLDEAISKSLRNVLREMDWSVYQTSADQADKEVGELEKNYQLGAAEKRKEQANKFRKYAAEESFKKHGIEPRRYHELKQYSNGRTDGIQPPTRKELKQFDAYNNDVNDFRRNR